MGEIIVSVLSLVYNQADYIEDMLKGFLLQETDFDFEIIIHDDASTDGTKEILKTYENEYPGKFHIIYEKENQWSKGVKITHDILLPLAKGKYIAFCEGDDFWIDKNKLQKQKVFLDDNLECICVAHNALMWNCIDNRLVTQNVYETSRYLTARDIIDRRHPSIATASKMHRREALELDDIFLHCGEVGDMPTDFYSFTKGKIYYMDEIMSVYRYQSNGSWSMGQKQSLMEMIKWRATMFNFLKNYNDYTQDKYSFYTQIYMSRAIHTIVDRIKKDFISKEHFYSKISTINEETGNCYEKGLLEIKRIVDLLAFNECDELLCKINIINPRNIYIYGAGKYAMMIHEFLHNHGIRIIKFIVSDINYDSSYIDNRSIISVDQIEEYNNKVDLIIVGVSAVFWEDVYQELVQRNITNYIVPLMAIID